MTGWGQNGRFRYREDFDRRQLHCGSGTPFCAGEVVAHLAVIIKGQQKFITSINGEWTYGEAG